MDLTTIAGATTAFLAPFVPTLVAKATMSFDEAVKKFGSNLGESTWKRITTLWSLIRDRMSTPDAKASKIDQALQVGDADARHLDWTSLRDSLVALMKTDPEFATKLAAIIADAKAREEQASFDIEKQIAKYIINTHSISHTHIGDRS